MEFHQFSSFIIRPEEQTLSEYLRNIEETHILSDEEERILFEEIKKGDQTAFELLVKSNLRFVIPILKNYENRGLGFLSLITIGNEGVMKAAKLFNKSIHVSFYSYLNWHIHQSIHSALGKPNQWVEKEINSEEHDIERFLTKLQQGTKTPFREQLNKEIYNWLTIYLTDRQSEFICLYYGIGISREYSVEEISEAANLTNTRINSIIEKGLQRIRILGTTIKYLFQNAEFLRQAEVRFAGDLYGWSKEVLLLKVRPNYIALSFDENQFDEKEIAKILLTINNLYESIGGDKIVITEINEKQITKEIFINEELANRKAKLKSYFNLEEDISDDHPSNQIKLTIRKDSKSELN